MKEMMSGAMRAKIIMSPSSSIRLIVFPLLAAMAIQLPVRRLNAPARLSEDFSLTPMMCRTFNERRDGDQGLVQSESLALKWVGKPIQSIMTFPGTTFKISANEISLGRGILTVLEDSFLFEAGNNKHVGFDFNNLRLVRAWNINSFDVAYSFQGSLQKTSFTTTPRYVRKNEGIEKDVTTDPLGWTMAFWKLHTITGAIVARMLADRSGAQREGLAPADKEEFESQVRQAEELIKRLPPQNEIATRNSTNEGELDRREEQLTGIFLRLTDAWLVGDLSQQQRERVAALCYRDQLKRYELGWYHAIASRFYSQMTTQDYKENAEDWLSEEKKWGSDLVGFTRA